MTTNDKFILSINEIYKAIENKKFIKQTFIKKGWNNNIYYITFEALKSADYPNGIKENGIYICFQIDTNLNKVERHSNGHVWLNTQDKLREIYKYYAMRSIIDIAEEEGIKKFRKCKYKDNKDLFDKIYRYFNDVMEKVNNYTGGYPYDPYIHNK